MSFAPIAGNRDRHFVSYSTEVGEYQYGFEFVNSENGVIAVEVKDLQPTTTYYFKVRAGNGCQPGEWSNRLSVKTGQRFPAYQWYSLPKIVATGVKRLLTPSAVTTIETDALAVAPIPSPAAKTNMGSPIQKSHVSASPLPTPTSGMLTSEDKGNWWTWFWGLFKGSYIRIGN